MKSGARQTTDGGDFIQVELIHHICVTHARCRNGARLHLCDLLCPSEDARTQISITLQMSPTLANLLITVRLC